MDWYTFMSSVFEHITVPIIILVGGVIIAVLKPYAKKITSSVTMKNEMESLEKMTKAKSNLMEQIDKLVESAVGANMQLAEKMKANGHKLTDDQIAELNRSAKDLVVTSLPIEVLDPEGDLYKLIGGEEKLDKMIVSLMEKHVYAYKLMRAQSEPKTYSQIVTNQPEPEYSEEIGFVTPLEAAEPVQEEVSENPEDDVPVSSETDEWTLDPSDFKHPPDTIPAPTTAMRPPARFGLG